MMLISIKSKTDIRIITIIIIIIIIIISYKTSKQP